jgi:hypothetical protein
MSSSVSAAMSRAANSAILRPELLSRLLLYTRRRSSIGPALAASESATGAGRTDPSCTRS